MHLCHQHFLTMLILTTKNNATMKQLIAIILTLSVYMLNAQTDEEYTATLMSFNGSGQYIREGKASDIKFPQHFKQGDKIKISEGEVSILIASGEEVIVKKGQLYEIPEFKDNNLASFDPDLFRDYDIQSQSNSAFKVRGEEVKVRIFPMSTKLIDNSNATLHWLFANNETMPVNIAIYNLNNDKEILNKKIEKTTSLDLSTVDFTEGEEYYWIFSVEGNSQEQMGAISVINKNQKEKLPEFKFKTKADFLRAYSFYMKNEYLFEACSALSRACSKYPNVDLFKYLKEKSVNCAE